MKPEEHLYLKMDGIQAILALSKFHQCMDVTKGMAIDQLARFVRMGRANCFAMGLIAFYFVFNKELITTYQENPGDNDLLSIFSTDMIDKDVALEATKEILADGYLMRYLKLLDIK